MMKSSNFYRFVERSDQIDCEPTTSCQEFTSFFKMIVSFLYTSAIETETLSVFVTEFYRTKYERVRKNFGDAPPIN